MRGADELTCDDALHPTFAPRCAEVDRSLERIGGAPVRAGNAFTLLRNGHGAYEDWLDAIRRARHWIHLENYIIRADSVGEAFAAALADRAASGVSVRLLYDWYGSWGTPRAFWRRLRRAGVEVRAMSPPRLAEPLSALRRDHRKLLAVDGRYASAGGVCIAEAWLERSTANGLPYRDTAVAVRGPAVADLERAFACAWATRGAPLPPHERPAPSSIPPVGDAAVRVVIQEPGRMRSIRVLELLCASVRRRLWMADAYFVGAPVLVQALIAAAQDGVDVRLLLPGTYDVPVVGPIARTGYRPLLRAGVRIWEYAGVMMHAKTTVADGWWARIGSTNLNPTGLATNWEIDVIAEDRRVGAWMERMFEEDLASAREVRLPRDGAVRDGAPRRRGAPPAEVRGRPGRVAVTLNTAAQLGTEMIAGERELDRNERRVALAIAGVLLGVALAGARVPRLLAWPLAGLAGLVGAATLVQAVRPGGGGAAPSAGRWDGAASPALHA